MSKKSPQENFDQYTTVSYSGRKLIEKHSLDEVGIWKIKGEDANADLHGSHYQPDLGIVEGKLRDVIMYGVNLPNFWQWGAGGNFEFVGESIPRIDAYSVIRRQEMQQEIEDAESRISQLKKQLGQA